VGDCPRNGRVVAGIVIRTLSPVVAILAFAVYAAAADPVPRRLTPPTTIQLEGPEQGEEDEGATPELRDDDDGFDDGHDVPSGPARRPRSLPGAPDEEQEEPSPPPDAAPIPTGPAEPASAMQPASPQR
jgi:hypothetical protein